MSLASEDAVTVPEKLALPSDASLSASTGFAAPVALCTPKERAV